ncbi:hypothetical protein FTUN_0683 [Frigoriglobus tundricola]|uniref:Uncharacterized protein n=1 Tax=Frigoriglobus tundricola TaxID=2774151 RepID=A0A6M5YGR1_9BACT|nr:hypothetical protein FTUN_0683 [Frigoriglobus tundricola]
MARFSLQNISPQRHKVRTKRHKESRRRKRGNAARKTLIASESRLPCNFFRKLFLASLWVIVRSWCLCGEIGF